VCDLSNSPYVDVAATRMLVALHGDLAGRATELWLVEARAGPRDQLWAKRLEEPMGCIGRHVSIEQAISE
jgi:hypothetical protein